jgi:DNA-binding NarL/FixJ family response regulator
MVMSKTKQAAQTRSSVRTVRTVCVDDQLVFRMGLRIYLAEAMPEVEWAGEAESIPAGIALSERVAPDLILLDAFLGDAAVDDVIGQFRAGTPDVAVVLFANLPDMKNLATAASSGANGYLLKTLAPVQMVEALRQVLRGVRWIQPELTQQLYAEFAQGPPAAASASEDEADLTPRQLEVLRLVAQGLRNAEIAERLTISEQTVKTHVAHLLEKLGVASRLQAARYAISRRLVDA